MIIGLGFRARVGKDAVAEYLVKKYGFKQTFYAESLKNACREIFHLTDEQLYGNLKEEVDAFWGVTPRFMFQFVGTECMRNVYGQDVWVRSLKRRIEKDSVSNWVISDVRFFTEAEAIKNWGGVLIHVDRKGVPKPAKIRLPPKWYRPWPKYVEHISETQLRDYKGWDVVIDNNGTLDDLYRRVDQLMEEFRCDPRLIRSCLPER